MPIDSHLPAPLLHPTIPLEGPVGSGFFVGMQRGQLSRFMEILKDLQGVRIKDPQPGTATLKFTIQITGTIQFPVKVNLGSIRLFQSLGLDKKEG